MRPTLSRGLPFRNFSRSVLDHNSIQARSALDAMSIPKEYRENVGKSPIFEKMGFEMSLCSKGASFWPPHYHAHDDSRECVDAYHTLHLVATKIGNIFLKISLLKGKYID